MAPAGPSLCPLVGVMSPEEESEGLPRPPPFSAEPPPLAANLLELASMTEEEEEEEEEEEPLRSALTLA